MSRARVLLAGIVATLTWWGAVVLRLPDPSPLDRAVGGVPRSRHTPRGPRRAGAKQVVDARGAGARGAIVHATPRGSAEGAGSEESVPADLDGRATIRGPSHVWAESADGSRATPRPVLAGPPDSIRLVISECARIEGRIVPWSPGGAAGAMVRVHCASWPPGQERREVTPDPSSGAFTVGGIHGFVSLYAVANGRCPSAPWSGIPRAGDALSVELRLGAEAVESMVTLVLPGGRPAEAGIEALVRSGQGAWQRARTGPGGTLSLPGVPQGGGAEVVVPAIRGLPGTGWLTALLRRNLEPEELRAGHRIDLPPSASISFRVRDSEGQPAAGQQFWLLAAGGPYVVPVGRCPTHEADAEGTVRPTNDRALPVGEYVLVSVERGEVWRGPVPERSRSTPVLDVMLPERARARRE